MGTFRFGTKDKLHKRFEFARVFKNGKRRSGALFEFMFLPNDFGGSRLGLVVSRKMGKAVKRNKIKRLVREAFRLNRSLLPFDVDLVARPRRDFKLSSFREVEADFVRFANRLGVSSHR